MKTKNFLLLLGVLFIFNFAKAQKDMETLVQTNAIVQAPLTKCGEIEAEARHILIYTIQNERKTELEIKEIKPPQGFMVTATEMKIKPGKSVNVYVIIETKLIDKKGDFAEKVIIKTNLVEDIVFDITGFLK